MQDSNGRPGPGRQLVPANLQLDALPASGDLQRYRVSGVLTLAGMLALEQTIAGLPGVSYAMVSPAPDGASATLLVRSEDSQGTLRAITNLPTFGIEAGQS
jgi:hypothetical protein